MDKEVLQKDTQLNIYNTKIMKNYEYCNPFKEEHVNLLTYLETQIDTKNNKINLYKFGPRTQHIFVNGKYLITID